MKITKLGSATVFIETENVKILCDPWLTDGIYYGSWFNYPPIDIDQYEFSDVDFIYISHIHPDHFDSKTMAYLDKSIPVLIHKYHKKFLKMNIEHLGFNVIELENGISKNLSETTYFTIYAADDCDPSVCGHMFGCITSEIEGSMQIDSLCVIDDGEHILVNTNDCPFGIAEATLKKIKKKHKKIDFALVGYTSASLYPHCMMDYDAAQMQAGIEKARDTGLQSGLHTLKVLEPAFFMPFAGTYILGGAYSYKNENLPIPEIQIAAQNFQDQLSHLGINSKSVLLNYGEFFDLPTGQQSAPYVPVNVGEKKDYIRSVASKFHYDFEDDKVPSAEELIDLFQSSIVRLNGKQLEINFFEDINLIFDISDSEFACINLKSGEISRTNTIDHLNNYHRFRLDPRLLKRALLGPRYANWNNIEIGAMLDFARKPDVYRMDVHTLVNALHV